MHPSCALVVWLAAVLGVQFVGYPGLLLLGSVALMSPPFAGKRCLGYVRRAKWLLLTLWLVLAYNTSGEAWHDQPWAPTYEGLAEANRQAVRLLVMLAWLAWLFVRLGREGLVSGLWGLIRPLQRMGLEVERLVVRLSLVLENLQTPTERGAWRSMLRLDAQLARGPSAVSLELAPWRARDTLLVLICMVGLLGVVWV